MKRLLTLSVLVPMLVVVLGAGQALAAKPVPTTHLDYSWSGCTVTLTLTWSGWGGRFEPTLAVVDNTNQIQDGSTGAATSGRTGSYTATFVLRTSDTAHSLTLDGALRNHAGDFVGEQPIPQSQNCQV